MHFLSFFQQIHRFLLHVKAVNIPVAQCPARDKSQAPPPLPPPSPSPPTAPAHSIILLLASEFGGLSLPAPPPVPSRPRQLGACVFWALRGNLSRPPHARCSTSAQRANTLSRRQGHDARALVSAKMVLYAMPLDWYPQWQYGTSQHGGRAEHDHAAEGGTGPSASHRDRPGGRPHAQ
ncbi:hypothetical protein SEVIR_2G149050v4 [Setaria viridis]|uniref:Uncharacterized protein n=1 Tax=Setaria viridis TaxID=4556 RepID=A0A4U6VTA3_SETVI|nr:hypothetical protein SEVIR_2G149050v2 [Setaria viridis]